MAIQTLLSRLSPEARRCLLGAAHGFVEVASLASLFSPAADRPMPLPSRVPSLAEELASIEALGLAGEERKAEIEARLEAYRGKLDLAAAADRRHIKAFYMSSAAGQSLGIGAVGTLVLWAIGVPDPTLPGLLLAALPLAAIVACLRLRGYRLRS